MTEQEAIEMMQGYQMTDAVDRAEYDAFQMAINALEEIQQYRDIGTAEECREAREKQISKKPIRSDMCTCPKCGTHNETIKRRRNTVPSDIVYCWYCGQAIEVKRSDVD